MSWHLIVAFLQIALLSIWIAAKPTEQIPTFADSPPVTDYHCSSAAESAYVQAANSLKRFVRYRDKLYFVFDKKTIFTRLPQLERDDQNRSFFIHYNFYEQVAQEDTLPVSAESKVIGHLHDAGTTQEIYSDGQSSQEEVYLDGRSGELCASEKAYDLTFSDKLAKRDQPVNLNADLYRHLNEKLRCKTSYVQALKDQAGLTVFGFNEENRTLTVERRLSSDQFQEAFRLNFSTNVRFFVVSKFEDQENFIEFQLIWVDDATSEIAYESYLIHKPQPGLIERQTQFKASLDELFSCHTRARKPREFKGVFFDRITGKFYIFIRRFYLQLDNDLVSRSFRLADSAYAKNAHELEYDGEQLKEFAEFSDQANVWVKNYLQQSYLMPASKLFEIEPTPTNGLAIRRSQLSVVTCSANILVFEGQYSYCFENDKYYFLEDIYGIQQWTPPKERFEIESIFSDFSLIHWNGQSVRFTFNYKDSQFVMMTASFLYVFDYRDFEVLQPNATIRFLNKFGSRRTLNCLFSPCPRTADGRDVDTVETEQPDTSPTIINLTTKDLPNTSETPKDEDPWHGRKYYIIGALIVLGLLILVVVLCLIRQIMWGEKLLQQPSGVGGPESGIVLPMDSRAQYHKQSVNSAKTLAILKKLVEAKAFATSKTLVNTKAGMRKK